MLVVVAAFGFQLGPQYALHMMPAISMDAKWVPTRKSSGPPSWLSGSSNVYKEQQSEYAAYAKAQQADATRDPAPTIDDGNNRTAHAFVANGQLKALATALGPQKIIVECGGGGMCGPNSLACVLAHAIGFGGSGDDVRRLVVAHGTELVRSRAMWEHDHSSNEDEEGSPLEGSVRAMIEESFATWANPGASVNSVNGLPIDPGVAWSAGPRFEVSAERWLRHMANQTAWVDLAFLALAADCFGVEITTHEVDGETGAIKTLCGAIISFRCEGDQDCFVVEPRRGEVKARVELAYASRLHFCAILPSEADAGGAFVYR